MLWVRPLVRVLAKSLVLSSLRNEFKASFCLLRVVLGCVQFRDSKNAFIHLFGRLAPSAEIKLSQKRRTCYNHQSKAEPHHGPLRWKPTRMRLPLRAHFNCSLLLWRQSISDDVEEATIALACRHWLWHLLVLNLHLLKNFTEFHSTPKKAGSKPVSNPASQPASKRAPNSIGQPEDANMRTQLHTEPHKYPNVGDCQPVSQPASQYDEHCSKQDLPQIIAHHLIMFRPAIQQQAL